MLVGVEEEEDGGADATHERPNDLKSGVTTEGDGEWNDTAQIEPPLPHRVKRASNTRKCLSRKSGHVESEVLSEHV